MMRLEDDRSAQVVGRVLREGDDGGVPGVAVSDGLTITRTDADGRYRLPIDPQRRHSSLVHLTVPAGWEAPTHGARAPAFFRKVEAAAGEEATADFVLRANEATEDHEYRFVALADVHVQAGAVNTREGFADQLEQINALALRVEQGAGPPRFVTVAGDLTNWATPAEFKDYLAATAASAMPVWSAPGNHDLSPREAGGPYPRPARDVPYRDLIEGYRQSIGPEWYSFQYGGHHFVVLESYRGLAERDQFRWLEQDLALNAAGKQVVVITHVPWNGPQTAPQAPAYLRLLERYDVRLLLAGHTHTNDVAAGVVGRAVQAVTTSTASTIDQTPRGFRLVELSGAGIELPFAELDADRAPRIVYPVGDVDLARQPATVQVSAYHPPGVDAQAEYRVPPRPWQPLRPLGRRAWAGDLDAVALAAGQPQQLQVRMRDRPAGRWTETTTTFTPGDGPVAPPRQGTPWPMFHRDATHSGLAADAVAPPLRLAWVRHSGGTILTSSPAVAHGTVFIGVRDEDGPAGNGVAALDLATGQPRWRAHTPGAVHASVAVAGDLVLAAPVRGPLYALEVATGRVRWEWRPDAAATPRCWMYYSPAIDGATAYHAYITTGGAGIAALDAASGQSRWRTRAPLGRNWASHASPAVAGDLVVFATAYANLVALDATGGDLRWQAAFGGGLHVGASPVIAGGTVLLARNGDRLVAIDAGSGKLRWSYDAPGASLLPGRATAATPAVAGGVVYTAFTDGSVTALHLDTGEELWRQRAQGAVISSPAISGQHLYVGSHDGQLRALDRETGECRWAHDLGARVASSPVVTGNTMIAAAWDGNVYAFTGN